MGPSSAGAPPWRGPATRRRASQPVASREWPTANASGIADGRSPSPRCSGQSQRAGCSSRLPGPAPTSQATSSAAGALRPWSPPRRRGGPVLPPRGLRASQAATRSPSPAATPSTLPSPSSVRAATAQRVQAERTTLLSSAGDYPIWGQLPAGVLSLLPGMAPIWWARIAEASIGVAWWPERSVSCPAADPWSPPACWPPSRRQPGRRSSWSIRLRWRSAARSRSGLACSMPTPRRLAPPAGSWDSDGSPLRCPAATGWSGPASPSLVALVHTGRTALEWWRDLDIGPRLLILVSSLVTAGWGLTTANRTTRLVALGSERARRRRAGALGVAPRAVDSGPGDRGDDRRAGRCPHRDRGAREPTGWVGRRARRAGSR